MALHCSVTMHRASGGGVGTRGGCRNGRGRVGECDVYLQRLFDTEIALRTISHWLACQPMAIMVRYAIPPQKNVVDKVLKALFGAIFDWKCVTLRIMKTIDHQLISVFSRLLHRFSSV